MFELEGGGMRIVRFTGPRGDGWGILEGDRVVELDAFRFDSPPEVAGRTWRIQEVRLRAPVAPPRNVFCLGQNYREHVRESPTPREEPTQPVWFTKTTTAIADPDADIPIDPTLVTHLDWEVELAVVIGKGGRNIPEDRALEHVYGYTVLNDLSARNLQFSRGGQWFYGKSLDGLCPVGPVLVTREEIPDPQALELRLRVNGEERQRGSTRDMIFPVSIAIADLSRGITLLPGDVIATGTPAGVGMGMRPPRFLQDGDVVEAEVVGIGVLRNRIVWTHPR